jgi:hypothetical protein
MTDNTVVARLAAVNQDVSAVGETIGVFLKGDPVYEKLSKDRKRVVCDCITRDLLDADRDRIMSRDEIVEYKMLRLEDWVPRLLRNMLDGQEAIRDEKWAVRIAESSERVPSKPKAETMEDKGRE